MDVLVVVLPHLDFLSAERFYNFIKGARLIKTQWVSFLLYLFSVNTAIKSAREHSQQDIGEQRDPGFYLLS